MKDKGVSCNYIDRHFKGVEEDLNYRRKVMTREEKEYYYAMKAAERERQKRQTLAEFEMVLECRPLKPPGRR